MKHIRNYSVAVVVMLLCGTAAFAMTAAEGKTSWQEKSSDRLRIAHAYNDAQKAYTDHKTPENEVALVDASKHLFNAALDEVEAWLLWKRAEVQSASNISEDIAQNVETDVQSNLLVINDLREQVAAVNSRVDAGILYLKMVGAYVGLVTDVARNSGSVWVQIGNNLAVKATQYEQKLRDAASGLSDSVAIRALLDSAHTEIESATSNLDAAKNAYAHVRLPGTPLISFAEGNKYLREAREALLNAHQYLVDSFQLVLKAKAN